MNKSNSHMPLSQKIVFALHFCKEHRSSVNDVFYFATLKHLDSSYIDSSIIPLEICEEIKETWTSCFKSISGDFHSLNERAKEHYSYWQELLNQPNMNFH